MDLKILNFISMSSAFKQVTFLFLVLFSCFGCQEKVGNVKTNRDPVRDIHRNLTLSEFKDINLRTRLSDYYFYSSMYQLFDSKKHNFKSLSDFKEGVIADNINLPDLILNDLYPNFYENYFDGNPLIEEVSQRIGEKLISLIVSITIQVEYPQLAHKLMYGPREEFANFEFEDPSPNNLFILKYKIKSLLSFDENRFLDLDKALANCRREYSTHIRVHIFDNEDPNSIFLLRDGKIKPLPLSYINSLTPIPINIVDSPLYTDQTKDKIAILNSAIDNEYNSLPSVANVQDQPYTNDSYKYNYRTGYTTNYTYNYDIEGYDENGNYFYGETDINNSDNYGEAYVYDEDGNEIEVELEWDGYGDLIGTDDDGNEYEFSIDN